jgi:hypothetical protein
MIEDIPRPRQHLAAAGKRHPGAWRKYDSFRQDLGRDGFPGWPEWCYCPLAGAYAIVSGGGDARISPQEIAGGTIGIRKRAGRTRAAARAPTSGALAHLPGRPRPC